MSEEGTVELKIDRFSDFVRDANSEKSSKKSSDPTYIYGLPWKILTCVHYLPSLSIKALTFYLLCNEEDDHPTWSCQARFELRVVSQKASEDDLVCKFVKKFTSEDISAGNHLITCDILLNPEFGFIKDDVVIIRAHVKADKETSRTIDARIKIWPGALDAAWSTSQQN